jgi:hypothetical protein
MSKKVIKRKAVLLLDKKTVTQKILFARAIVIAMTGNAYFPAPTPALSVITRDANNLENASVAAQTRAKGTSAEMNVMVKFLELSLRALANYVEFIANADSANAVAIIESAGMTVKRTSATQPRVLAVVASGKGEVTLTCPTEKYGSYKWEITTGDPMIEANWKFFVEVRQSKTVQTGLLSATLYHFRQSTFGRNGLGPLSYVLSTTVL